MHEMALTQEIVDLCLQHAEGKPVLAVIVEIGVLSGVVPEAVEFCFAACSNGTLVASARLEIRQTAGLGRCLACHTTQSISQLYDPCQQCGSYALEIIGGKEMRVVAIEVENEKRAAPR